MQNSCLEPSWNVETWQWTEQSTIHDVGLRTFAIIESSFMPNWKTQFDNQVKKKDIAPLCMCEFLMIPHTNQLIMALCWLNSPCFLNCNNNG